MDVDISTEIVLLIHVLIHSKMATISSDAVLRIIGFKPSKMANVRVLKVYLSIPPLESYWGPTLNNPVTRLTDDFFSSPLLVT